MTANRIIPYGYRVEKGRNVPHPEERQIVQRIFTEYIGGASLLQIAQVLTAEKVEFIPGRSDWNKNRIGRILADERYCGTETYPAIVDVDAYNQAREKRQLRVNSVELIMKESPVGDDFSMSRLQPTPSLSTINCQLSTVCAACGAKMSRRHDARRKTSQEVWTCRNPECRQVVNLNDADLMVGIVRILERLIAAPSLIQTDTAPAEPSMEARQLQGEVNRQLDAHDPDKDAFKIAVFALAAEKYRGLNTDETMTHILRAAFEDSTLSAKPLSSFIDIASLFKRTVLKVQLGASGEISLVLKNHQIVGGA
jgi:hypothetical protein